MWCARKGACYDAQMTVSWKSVQTAALILTVVGMMDAAYLSYSRVTSSPLFCGKGGGCAIVEASPYSVFAGVPLAFWGLAFYIGMFFVCALLIGRYERPARALFLLGALIGALMSLSFLYIQGVLIGAWCIYCVASAVITFALFAAAVVGKYRAV